MKALLIYNPVSGHHKIRKYIPYIDKVFSESFDSYTKIESQSPEHFKQSIIDKSEFYDVLIIGGGDGTINMAINALEFCSKKPYLGFIPAGTINDSVRNIGCNTNIKKAVKSIVRLNKCEVDIIRVNGLNALYCLACGAFSDIPYVTNNKLKVIFGRFAYYFYAVPRLFKKVRIVGTVNLPNKKDIRFITPFILLLNGKRMGGFTINKESILDDGLAELYLAKPSLMNSLPKYFFFRNRIPCYHSSEFHFYLEQETAWTIDGEKCFGKDFDVKILNNYFKILK